jgi:hypothetical protein
MHVVRHHLPLPSTNPRNLSGSNGCEASARLILYQCPKSRPALRACVGVTSSVIMVPSLVRHRRELVRKTHPREASRWTI